MRENENELTRVISRMVDISSLTGSRKNRYVTEYSSLESDYVFLRMTSDGDNLSSPVGPLKVNGLVFCFVASGYIKVDINLDSYTVESDSLLTAPPATIFNLKEMDSENLDAYVLILSPDFMRDINLDLNVLHATRVRRREGPIMKIAPDDCSLLLKYLELLHLNTKDNHDSIYIRSISRCLLASIVYQLLQFESTRAMAETSDEDGKPQSRRSNYVQEFMELVHRYHKQERSVAFYASKLFITPKYLSLVVKETTGRSAAEWIDNFVILEAKNLLRFSHKNIQEIAYELNFSNQSSFGKYFKNLTGMSPSAYQRS